VAPGERVSAGDITLTTTAHGLSRATEAPLQPMGTESARCNYRSGRLRMRACDYEASLPGEPISLQPVQAEADLYTVEFYKRLRI
jgi:hypothetical protein